MSSIIKLKRSSTPSKIPATSGLAAGEVSINTYDGKLFFKKTVGGTDSIVTLQESPYTGGTGVTINSGTVSIGQTVATTASPSFAGLNISPSGYADSLKVTDNGDVTITKNLILPGTLTDGISSAGSDGQVLTSTSSGVRWKTAGALTVRNTVGDGGTVNTEVTNVSAINFDYSTGIHVNDKGSGEIFVSLGSSFKTIQVDGQSDLVAVGEDTLQLVAGAGIRLRTNSTAPKSITISSTGGGGGGSTAPLKTFNILGSFGPLLGTARFYPTAPDTIQTITLAVSTPVTANLTLGLYRNNIIIQYFIIPTGLQYISYDSLTIDITTGEYYTVNVESGNGSNLAMTMFNY